MSFNPRSHEGNDNILDAQFDDMNVSIHVPTRGTTRIRAVIGINANVSIHVPTRGTTHLPALFCNFLKVSIHVPTRGTTILHEVQYNLYKVSIHVPTRGTTILLSIMLPLSWFQSTFPRGERRNLRSFRPSLIGFNPRSHEGNDMG